MSRVSLSRNIVVNDVGQIQIPLEFCDALGIREGYDLIATLVDDQIVLQTRQSKAKRLRGILKATDARDLTSELLEERRLETKRKGF